MSATWHLAGLIPLAIGGAVTMLARSYGEMMIRYTEASLRLMRRPGFLWVYRAYGLMFALAGILILFVPE